MTARSGQSGQSSPRPWGCFQAFVIMPDFSTVFPTPVGVFLIVYPQCPATASLPHARGGVSVQRLQAKFQQRSSPRPWGCFSGHQTRHRINRVFPTPVGVFPAFAQSFGLPCSLPHARGGVSQDGKYCFSKILSSPRPWGCFLRRCALLAADTVFPTPVGVFPALLVRCLTWSGLPHARGGVSHPCLYAG